MMTEKSNRTLLARWGFVFSIFTGIFLSLISLRFFHYMPDISSVKAGLFISTGVFSHFSAIALATFIILFWPLSILTANSGLANKSLKGLTILIAACGALLLIADTFVYAQYRFHISGFVFEMLLQAGNDIIELSWVTWLIAILVFVGCIAGFYYLSKLADKSIRAKRWTTYKRIYLALFFASLLTSNGIHIISDATYEKSVTTLVRHIPMFSPLTGKKALLKSGFLDAASLRQESQALGNVKASGLNYPKQPIVSQAPAKKTNILLIIVDSLRYDMLAADVMPNTYYWSQQNNKQVFDDHISGGNSTRTGVFNLFYGLPGTYWSAFSTNQKAPVLMDTLQNHNYDMQIFAAAPLTQPAFDRTIFAGVSDLKLKADGNKPWQKDDDITANWMQFVEQYDNDKDQPFFGFLFYDGVHGYSMPDEQPKKFQPSWDRVDHLSLNPDLDPTEYFNLYKNATHRVDDHIGKVLKQLEAKGLMDNTVVIFTSDHGQEFNDNQLNYWGHGSNFTEVQVKVPLVIHWPGEPKQQFAHRTSHSDISITLLQKIFSVDNPISDYAIGHPLNEVQRNNWLIAGSYVNFAIIEPNQHTVTYQDGSFETLNNRGEVQPDKSPSSKTALEAMDAMSRFYK